ncbi:DinB family protein [Streptomyces sp. NPDC014892]|uniref:DinB family protein n=1 Tax=Streptomyces TaxID=1883 RepID=UPI001EFB2F0E|nr:DinB family protein [Streptomyces deccanensis]ULR48204.1 DinB family protein [Streptomyces deccanensis]
MTDLRGTRPDAQPRHEHPLDARPLSPQPPQEQPLPERRPGWGDRFVGPEGDPRGEGGFEGERATLVGYLRNQRLTLELKCAGLDAEALARRSVPPSNLSLLGLVRHLAGVEQYWFREALAGRPEPRHYRAGEDPDGDFNEAVADPEAVADAWRTWRAEVDFAERFVAAAPDLAVTGHHDGAPIALREVLVHLIEEYARHNGHADLLRERVDGRIGQ